MDFDFWMVWKERGGTPTVQHTTREAATKEAERLAAQMPGARFYVLRAERYAVRNDVKIVELEPPF